MWKRIRPWCGAPVFPGVLILGALILKLPWIKCACLGLLAAAATALAVLLLSPREEPAVPRGWRKDLKQLKRRVEKIKNKTVYRGGREILTELKQCETALPFLSQGARREITEYYLPTFAKYFDAYATFEECNEGNPSVLNTMAQMEDTIGEIAANFRKTCDRNDKTAALNVRAETAVLFKKLNTREDTNE